MNSLDASSAIASREPGCPTQDHSIPELVAEVYESAPAVERGYLLEQLLRPLSVLSLFAVAGGIFANVRFRGGWPQLKVQIEDIRNVRADHVVALVDYAQQVSVETVDGLAQMLAASPVMSGSTAAAMLVTVLAQRALARQTGTRQIDATSLRSSN